jgi:methyl-accepting chemotaxis protein WspA
VNEFFDGQYRPKYKAYAAALDDLITDNFGDGVALAKEIDGAVITTRSVVLVGSLISLAVSVLIAWSVTQSLRETLEKLAAALLRVNTSSNEMAATLKEQQASANEMASTTVEIGATSKEISATSKELGKTMGEVAKVAEQTAQLASGGQSGLTRMEATMRQILEAASTISAKLAILNEKTTNINAVVTTINKVADQTNLLSLNAAIEAEKAGEYGQGFAVVATEIRRLADQTAVATYDIEQMVKEMQSAVAAGVMGMDKFNEEVRRGGEEARQVTVQLGEIIQQVQAQTPRFEAVNEGMQTQATGAGQISEALGQLGETAQQSAQALRQNTEALEQLSLAARGLHEAQALFKDQSHAVPRVSS